MKCEQCLCLPAECKRQQCIVCSEQKCCASAHPGLFGRTRNLFAAALGIEILCIASAELGENAGLYLLGFNPAGIAIAFAMGYALAGLATFVAILGRGRADPCCSSMLEHESRMGFLPNFQGTLRDFAAGTKRLARIRSEPGLKGIVKSSIVILVTAESACIMTAQVVDLVLYQYSLLISVPLALFAGASAIVAVQYLKKFRATG